MQDTTKCGAPTSITFNANATDASGVASVKLRVSYPAISWVFDFNMTYTGVGSTWTTAVSYTQLQTYGTHAYQVIATDTVGNIRTASDASWTFNYGFCIT
jgi:hypothetical protein